MQEIRKSRKSVKNIISEKVGNQKKQEINKVEILKKQEIRKGDYEEEKN